MKFGTKFIAAFLAVTAAVTTTPVSAFAADMEEIETTNLEEVLLIENEEETDEQTSSTEENAELGTSNLEEVSPIENEDNPPILIEEEIESDLKMNDTEADPVGTNPIVLTAGVQATSQIPYDSSRDYNDGNNYKDFSIYVPTDGTLKITFDVSIDHSTIEVFSDYTKETIATSFSNTTGGRYTKSNYCGTWNEWNSTAGIYAGVYTCNVTKGTYLIRIARYFCSSQYCHNGKAGKDGNGKMHIIAEMEKPDCPTDIELNSRTYSSLTVDWIGPDNATSYDIRYKTASGSWKTVSGITENTATISGLSPSTTYTYQVRTRAGDIIGDWSASSYATTSESPAPQNVEAVKNNKRVKLSWSAVNGATGYIVKSADGKTQYTSSAIKTTSYTVTGLTNGTQYKFKVYAYVNGSWHGSSKISATPTASPQNVTAGTASKSVPLTWTAANGATGYIVKSADGKTQYTKSTIKTNSYTVTGLTNGKQYKFKVYACVSGKWYASSTVTKTPTGAPQNVTATAGSKKITLSWTKVNGATGYIIKSADGKTQYTKKSITTNSYTVTGLTGGTQYKFKVYASNTITRSAKS